MMIASGMAVIGTPDDAIAQIERLQSQSGGFGCFLQMAHNWADWAQTQRSYELIARHVAPKFQGSNVNRDESYARVGAGREATMGQARAAIGASIFKHVAEKGTDNIRPEILEVMGMAKKPDAAE
jgi:limonene 1,2-monooxygenase